MFYFVAHADSVWYFLMASGSWRKELSDGGVALRQTLLAKIRGSLRTHPWWHRGWEYPVKFVTVTSSAGPAEKKKNFYVEAGTKST